MKKTENGWIANVTLHPGKYWYKFIVDNNWITDDDNLLKENDGLGNTNSVYFKPNVVFSLSDFIDAKKVFVAGSFNNWRKKELQMIKTKSGWQLPMYLGDGTHTYKFIVDGKWITENKKLERLPDGTGGYNSVIEIGKPHIFKLNGYKNAKQVILSGSFNGWRNDELLMHNTGDGWQLSYVIGAGNYEYKFIVDGNWITDPGNPLVITNDDGIQNSYLIIDPNYTFHLKGYGNAKSVFLAGDFNNWSPQTLAMKKEDDSWTFSVHLTTGKHLYKFIVDGKWIIDPENILWEQNEYGTGNSIVWIDK
jgi:1,4-alpha-glucan branching enzyme